MRSRDHLMLPANARSDNRARTGVPDACANEAVFFPWNEHFEIGIVELDEQHQELFRILNRVAHQVAFAQDDAALRRAIDDLNDYAIYHFEAEESIWKRHLGDARVVGEHEKTHKRFSAKIDRLKSPLVSSDRVAVEELLSFLTKWIVEHIITADRRFGLMVSYVQSGDTLKSARQKADQEHASSIIYLRGVFSSLYEQMVRNVILLMTHVQKRRNTEEMNRKLAYQDSLTSLDNRAALTEKAKHILRVAAENDEQCSLFFIDIDNFKTINDSFGHHVGDIAINNVADKIRRFIRDSDVLCRLGGDDFVLLCYKMNAASAERVAKRLVNLVSRSFLHGKFDLTVTASVGVAVYPENAGSFEDLLKAADIAMHQSKSGGRGKYCFFCDEMQVKSDRKMLVIEAIRAALRTDRLRIVYQPKFSAATGEVTGAEALARLTDPRLGPVSPEEFIPIAEETGLIRPLGEWLLRRVAREAKFCIQQGLPLRALNVNVSMEQMKVPGFHELVRTILEESEVPGSFFRFEITETVATDADDQVLREIDRLCASGISLSMDDFGTGYSSLARLRRFKFREIKIDRSFVNGIGADLDDEAIIEATIAMAGKLGISVTAEGVETQLQRDFLRARGCMEMQGYLYSRPLSWGDFVRFLSTGVASAGTVSSEEDDSDVAQRVLHG